MCNFSQGVWEKGQSDGILSSIKNLMKNTGWPIEQAMTALKVPETDWPKSPGVIGWAGIEQRRRIIIMR